jgi:membrane fusion protein, heavy metal efflux system
MNFKTLAMMMFISAACVDAPRAADNPLKLDPTTARTAGIVVDTIAPRTLGEELRASGEVRADAYASALVTPRVQSIVLARHARLGDHVRAGDVLVELVSVEVAQAQGELIIADQDWRRVQALGLQAVSARRYYTAKVQRDQSRARLRAYGLSNRQLSALLQAGSSEADGRFTLTAPAAGRITTDNFMLGQRVEPGAPLFTIVDEAKVWVEARLPPADASRARPGAEAKILWNGRELPARIVQSVHLADETTRTVSVRITVDNAMDELHAGELVDARIRIGERAALAVPAEAVVLLKDASVVFVPGDGDTFEPVVIEPGATRDGWTEVRQGLKTGDAYVARGSFVLKARLLRSQLGDE